MAYLRFAVPVLSVFYGTSLIADEVEGKTITYLFTRPVSRSAVLVGKYAAFLVCTALVVLPSVMITYAVIVPIKADALGMAFPALVADLGAVTPGLASYGALFTLMGTAVKGPLLMGLIFIFGWEPIAIALPGHLKYLTVTHYLQALVSHAMPSSAASVLQSFLREAPSLGTGLVALTAIWIGSLVLAAVVVERREFVPRS